MFDSVQGYQVVVSYRGAKVLYHEGKAAKAKSQIFLHCEPLTEVSLCKGELPLHGQGQVAGDADGRQ